MFLSDEKVKLLSWALIFLRPLNASEIKKRCDIQEYTSASVSLKVRR